jgi:hypothetical protein
MKTSCTQNFVATALAFAVSATIASAQEAVQTRVGELGFQHGIPCKMWFMYFRAYSPLKPFLDRSWVLPGVEKGK